VDAQGPRAAITQQLSEQGNYVDEHMLSFLDGIAPDGAVSLKSSSVGVKAWLLGGRYYVRADLPLLWPAYSRVVSQGGAYPLWVYEMAPVSSLVFSATGKPLSVSLDRYPSAAEAFESSVRQGKAGAPKDALAGQGEKGLN